MIPHGLRNWLPSGGLVLDVGCATGTSTRALTSGGYRAVGLELDPVLLGRLRQDPTTSGVAACRGDARTLPVHDGVADAAVLIEVLEHIPEPDRVLRELRRVLRPGGRLCVAVPTGYTEVVYHRLHPRYLTNAGHVNRFGRKDVERRLNDAGFNVARSEPTNLAPAVSWLIHALLASEADHTGRLLEHRWVDRAVGGAFWILRRTPVVRLLLQALQARVGKSRYFYCVAA